MIEELIHNKHPHTKGKSPLELASAGYKIAAREEARRKKPVQPPLSSIGARIGSEYGELVQRPPDRTEKGYLEPGMQRLLDSLTQANKGLEAIDKLEGEIRQTQGEIYQAVADKNADRLKDREETLKMQQRTLANVRSTIEEAVRFAKNVQVNSPEKIATAKAMLGKLRTEVTLPYSYEDAQDNLPPHTNQAIEYLEKIKAGGNSDERHTATKALSDAGINPADIFKTVEHYSMSPTDQAIVEMRDKESKSQADQIVEGLKAPSTEPSMPRTVSQNIGHESPGES